MVLDNALKKRIKRQITGRIQNFFAVTAPGFEKICFDELMALPLSMHEASIVNGGIEFKGRVHDCYLANLHLRTAGRILMRMGEFKASNFRTLEKKLSDFPWELFLTQDSNPQINITSRHSRLYHKNAIADRFTSGIIKYFSRTHPIVDLTQPASPQTIFVRAVNDHFTLSIDSSGDLLYKRGIKKHGGKAPIRETTAAAALKLAGYTGKEPLIDPMCGSGTFSLEGAMMVKHIPSGWFRDNFAFMGWPCFRPQRWNYIKQECGHSVIQADHPLVFASDINQNDCDSLQKSITESDLSDSVYVCCRDFFEITPKNFSEGDTLKTTGLVALNPPYGLRIGSKQESSKLFSEIINKLEKDFKRWKIALILPDKKLLNKIPVNLDRHDLFHGGLKLTLLTGRV